MNDQTESHESGKDLRLPVYLEASLTFSRILVMLLGISVTLISLSVGSTIQASAMRGGVAALLMGLFTWFLNWYLNQCSLEEISDEVKKINRDRQEESTIEKVA